MHRRSEDHVIYKVVKLWLIIITLVGGIVMLAILKRQTEENTYELRKHEKRLTQVELNAAISRLNTDALVSNLLSEKQQRGIRDQVDGVSTYILKAAESRQEER